MLRQDLAIFYNLCIGEEIIACSEKANAINKIRKNVFKIKSPALKTSEKRPCVFIILFSAFSTAAIFLLVFQIFSSNFYERWILFLLRNVMIEP